MTELIFGLHHLKAKHLARVDSQQLDFRQGAAKMSNRSVCRIHEDCELSGNAAENSSAKSILTIGNFDGVHQGHKVIIRALQQQAKLLHLPSCVMLFEPHPQEFFLQEKASARLMRLREKIKILKDLSVDRIVCLRFNKHLAGMSAETFVKEILVAKLGVRSLIVGDDFRFGKGRQGDFASLKKLGRQYGFEVHATPTVLFEGERIGSSRVRNALKEGDFSLAKQLLTRPFTLSGRVIQGDQRGRLLGFATANIALHRLVLPVSGVFMVRVHGLGEKPFNAVANCGRRPTVNGLKDLLEIHLLDFNTDIYGVCLEIEFLKKIREEKKFSSLEELKQQIEADVKWAKEVFKALYG
ncbi:bifunctional flavokinase/ FAD synthetase [Candidatus Rickettsiella viridis]|uniref:Riboflavin biosynthesis protein n=1 Tax=Candidatus Rickettsiella viridis TaxID=676208 RepID=A0A2Z5UT98_9COXI|nr:bifunctional riboflavin kinase/FAD synthetase [Candidatus Rickettsiella viridis]BBB14826.1 bifunctional flavokinase/ FAD synthetase [Candidatus Rickettsiella viridis]